MRKNSDNFSNEMFNSRLHAPTSNALMTENMIMNTRFNALITENMIMNMRLDELINKMVEFEQQERKEWIDIFNKNKIYVVKDLMDTGDALFALAMIKIPLGVYGRINALMIEKLNTYLNGLMTKNTGIELVELLEHKLSTPSVIPVTTTTSNTQGDRWETIKEEFIALDNEKPLLKITGRKVKTQAKEDFAKLTQELETRRER